MTHAVQYQIEQTGDTASLYLFGVVRHTDVIASLSEICNALPDSVRILRLDLNAVRHIGGDAMEAIGIMLCEWREGRAGDFRLLFGSGYTSSCGVVSHLRGPTHPAPLMRGGPAGEARSGN